MRFTLTLPFLLSTAVAEILVPPPTGPYEVAMKVQKVIDSSRLQDPLSASTQKKGRPILFTVFHPVQKTSENSSCPKETVPYMTPKVAADYGKQAAEAGLPSELYSYFSMEVANTTRLKSCGGDGSRGGKFPVALFTPGLQESRLLYGAGARSLASRGYVVVTVDHPYEASFVEFPDGSLIQGRNVSGGDDATKEKLVEIRTADLSFVIDQLHNHTLVKSLLGPFSKSLDLNKVAVYSHSLGGAAAASLTRTDKRVLGGVNIDGQLVEPTRTLGLSKPFLLAGRYNHSSEDPTWNQFWTHLKGPRVELAINGTVHGAFTDRPLLVTALGLDESALKGVEGLIGSVEGRRLEKIVNDVLVGFFNYVFYKDEGIRSLPSKYAEVSIPRSNM